MTQEEKARAYDEALEKATTYYDNAKVVGDHSAVARYENMFPELAESEDERMVRAIEHILYENYSDAAIIEGVEIAEIVAWLEKQKEPVIDKEGMYYYLGGKFIYCGYPAMEENPYDFAMSQQEKQKEQKDYHKLYDDIAKSEWFKKAYKGKSLGYDDEQKEQKPKTIKEYHEAFDKLYGDYEPDLQPIEQKPVEYLDKDKVYAIMNKLHELAFSQLIPINSDEYKKIDEITTDVRDLLNYPIEQKPVKWSEEDEKIRKTLLDYYEEALDNYTCVEWLNGITYGELCDWLKSLRPSWKPSEEQMMALKDVAYGTYQNGDGPVLRDLYEQLKKFKKD